MKIADLFSMTAIALAAGLGFAASADAQSKPELRIATITSVTGSASSLGAPERRAVDLLERLFASNADLPFTVKFVNYDDASDPTMSVNLARKAIEEDGVHAIVCCTTTPGSMALLDTVKAASTPMVSMASAASIVTPAAERPFTFKATTSDHLMFERMLAYMKRQGITKIAFFGLEDSYGETGLTELRNVAKDMGVEIISMERFARQDTNFTPQALRLRQSQPQAVYIHAIPPSANLAHEALLRVGYKGPVYHGAGSSINSFVEIGKQNVEGAIVGVGAMNVYDQLSAENPMRPGLMEFAEQYNGAYGKGSVDLFAGQAWDAVRLVAHAYGVALENGKATGDTAATRLAIKDALESTKDYFGVNGVYNITPADHLGLDQRSTFLAQVRGGKFVLIEE